MELLHFSIQFEKSKCANLDVLVSRGINQVYQMVQQITAMKDEEIALFMLNFPNIVYLQEHDDDDTFIHKTLEQLPSWFKDIQARARQETTLARAYK